MGDKTAPKEFLKAFHDVTVEWQTRRPAYQPLLYMSCPTIADGIIDGSITTFADDVWKKQLVNQGTK